MMIPMDEIKSEILKLKHLYFKNIDYSSQLPSDGKKSVRVGFKQEHTIEGENISASLFCHIEVENISKLEMCLCGDFVCTNPEKAEKFLPNVFSIMFPYLRSQVTVMTAMPGCPSIVLPALNIVNLLKHSQEKNNAKK